MAEHPISIVCFLWTRYTCGAQLPCICNYNSLHVNALYRAIQRNVTIPYKFICVTDKDPNNLMLDEGIHTIKLWDKCMHLGGCYNRLFIFSPIMEAILGKRFICIDLDVVITGNLDKLLSRSEPFIMNEYAGTFASEQYYNGGLIMQTAGVHKEIWEDFDYIKSPAELQIRKSKLELVGTDQAWISHKLGPGHPRFTREDGCYDIRMLNDPYNPPENAKIIFFPGKRDPSDARYKFAWVREHWG